MNIRTDTLTQPINSRTPVTMAAVNSVNQHQSSCRNADGGVFSHPQTKFILNPEERLRSPNRTTAPTGPKAQNSHGIRSCLKFFFTIPGLRASTIHVRASFLSEKLATCKFRTWCFWKRKSCGLSRAPFQESSLCPKPWNHRNPYKPKHTSKPQATKH